MTENLLDRAASMFTELQAYVGRVNTEHGFREHLATIDRPDHLVREQANALMLIVSEVAEAHDEIRSGRAADEIYHAIEGDIVRPNDPSKGFPWVGEAGVQYSGPAKPEGVPSEIADVVIRCLDFADAYGFDLGQIVAEKIAYNETRPHKHGRKF